MGRGAGPGKDQRQLLATPELRNQSRPRTSQSCEIAGNGAAGGPFERRRFGKPAIEDRRSWTRRVAPESGRKRLRESETGRAQRVGFAGQHCRRSEEHTSELQSLTNLVCRLLLDKKKKTTA